jgi:DNA-binding LacI/PurR family transcriptional regulator
LADYEVGGRLDSEEKMKPGKTPVTIYDVAKLAAVSVATVSRALNKPEMVREKTIAKVLAAIEACGYSPNLDARRLSLTRSGIY